MSDLACDEISALAAELALGILSGDERANALQHLDGCPACRDRVDAMAHVADQLLLAAPEEEPPIGFESRVLEGVAAERQPATTQIRPVRRWTTIVLAAAAAIVVGASLAGVAVARAGGRGGHSGIQSATVKFGGGNWVCRVTAFTGQSGRPTELVVRLDEPMEAYAVRYTVEVQPVAGGSPLTVGTIGVTGGHGVLDTTLPSGTGRIVGIRVFSANRELRYQANFASPA